MYDATFSAKGYGTKTAKCTGLGWGTTIEGSDSESRSHSTFYPKLVTASQFSVRVAFPTQKLWREFNEWVEKYARSISNPNGTVGPMVVSVPARKFLKVAIPVDGFEYGDQTAALVRETTITFEGTNDPVKPGQRGTSSEPSIPRDDIVATFYPTGYQAGSVADSLYNGATSATVSIGKSAAAALNGLTQNNGGPTSITNPTGDNAPGMYD